METNNRKPINDKCFAWFFFFFYIKIKKKLHKNARPGGEGGVLPSGK